MFYSETILSRRGPLGRVWLAAHMERKLSKSQTLQTDIEKSVDAIMGQEIEVMALRLSGQLLLGVVRIYSRKAKYLLDDCNEALLKIKMAFRPGVVDLTEEQLTVNKNAITLPTNGVVLDLLMPDVDWDMDFDDRPLQRQGHHQAHVDDITLRTADDFQLGGHGDAFDIGPSDGIGSQDFHDLDLGIDWDGPRNEPNDGSDMMSVDGSVGVGRDAQIGRDSLEPGHILKNGYGADFDALSQREKSREASEAPFDVEMGLDIPGVDLTEFGVGFDDIPPAEEDVPALDANPALSRGSSPLSDVPPTPPPLDDRDVDAQPAETAGEKVEKAKRRPKDKKQIIDDVTELQNESQSNRGRAAVNANPLNMDTTIITSQQHYLPRSSIVMRLLEIRDDPINHFLPTHPKGNNTVFSAAPPGLAPELAQLFSRSMPVSPLKRKGLPIDDSAGKRSRRGEVEMPRRAESQAPSEVPGRLEGDAGFDGGISFGDHSAQIDDFQLDIPAEVDQDLGEGREKSVVTDRSRQSSLAPGAEYEEHVIDGSCPVAIFDVSQPSQTQPGEKDADEDDIPDNDKGYSKNTIKALGLMRRELQPDGDETPKTMSFKKMTANASRRAASSFFFELLVLGTRNCIDVSQKTSFADIQVQAKGRLWEHQHHLQGNLDRLSEPLMA